MEFDLEPEQIIQALAEENEAYEMRIACLEGLVRALRSQLRDVAQGLDAGKWRMVLVSHPETGEQLYQRVEMPADQ